MLAIRRVEDGCRINKVIVLSRNGYSELSVECVYAVTRESRKIRESKDDIMILFSLFYIVPSNVKERYASATAVSLSVADCLFHSCVAAYGGAIYIVNSGSSLQVVDTMFENCSDYSYTRFGVTSSNGVNLAGACILSYIKSGTITRVCAHRCSSLKAIFCFDLSPGLNIDITSVSGACLKVSVIFYIFSARMTEKYSNISKSEGAGTYAGYPTSSTSSLYKFDEYRNNTGAYMIWLEHLGKSAEASYVSFINNQGDTPVVVFGSEGTLSNALYINSGTSIYSSRGGGSLSWSECYSPDGLIAAFKATNTRMPEYTTVMYDCGMHTSLFTTVKSNSMLWILATFLTAINS